jgi:tetratricopeptide (TPR) repeat protein
VSPRNASQRAEQRKLREQMRGLGMNRAEIAAEMARRYKLRPRPAWRSAWGWTLEEAAERYNSLRAEDTAHPVTALTGSRLSEWENWPLSARKPPVTSLCLLAEIYQCGVLDLIDFHDREKYTAPELLALDKIGNTSVYRTVPAAPPILISGVESDSDNRQDTSAAVSLTAPMRLRLKGLLTPQLDELIGLLDEQWHALVKIDNLLGPRHALVGVRMQLDIIEILLRDIRPPARRQVLHLAAKYAESAAWLCEDSGDNAAARRWTGRSMEWAIEADDQQMVAWSLFRRSQQATTAGDAAQVAGLAAAAQRQADGMPAPARAAILQQRAHAYALDGDETSCQKTIDKALALAAGPDDPGDASSGHGSFCTPGYLEMQRGMCWLRLNRPTKAITAFDTAVRSMPAVYRRDHGVALSGQATALAAAGKPEQAALAASQALGIAQDSGSGRILNMVIALADHLLPYGYLEAVAELQAALPGTPPV